MKYLSLILIFISIQLHALTFKSDGTVIKSDGTVVESTKELSASNSSSQNRPKNIYKEDNLKLLNHLIKTDNSKYKVKPLELNGTPMKSTVGSWENHGRFNGSIEVRDRPDLAFKGNNFFHVTVSKDQCDPKIILEGGFTQCDFDTIRNEYIGEKYSADNSKTLWIQYSFQPKKNIIIGNPLYQKLFFISQCKNSGKGNPTFGMKIKEHLLFAKVKLFEEGKGIVLTDFPLMEFEQNKITDDLGYEDWITVRYWLNYDLGFQIWVNDKIAAEYQGKLADIEVYQINDDKKKYKYQNENSCRHKHGVYMNGFGYKNDPTKKEMTVWFDNAVAGYSLEELEKNLNKVD